MTRAARIIAVAGASVSLLSGTAADAHHAIGATVDTTTQVVKVMTLTKIDWINPHTWFHFDMTQPDGSIAKGVLIEWMNLSSMRQAGYQSAEDFALGTYTVTYYPNRDGSPGGHLVKMEDSRGQRYGRN